MEQKRGRRPRSPPTISPPLPSKKSKKRTLEAFWRQKETANPPGVVLLSPPAPLPSAWVPMRREEGASATRNQSLPQRHPPGHIFRQHLSGEAPGAPSHASHQLSAARYTAAAPLSPRLRRAHPRPLSPLPLRVRSTPTTLSRSPHPAAWGKRGLQPADFPPA